MSAPRLAHF